MFFSYKISDSEIENLKQIYNKYSCCENDLEQASKWIDEFVNIVKRNKRNQCWVQTWQVLQINQQKLELPMEWKGETVSWGFVGARSIMENFLKDLT